MQLTVSNFSPLETDIPKLCELLRRVEEVVVAGVPRHAHRHGHQQSVAQLKQDPRKCQQTLTNTSRPTRAEVNGRSALMHSH